MNIFIAEDNLLMVGVLKEALEEQGYKIVGSASSEQLSIKGILETKPDIALIDIELENGNGLNVIKAVCSAVNTKFVILTSHKSEDEFLNVMDNNTFAYCNKSLPIDYLKTVIENVISGDFWVDPLLE